MDQKQIIDSWNQRAALQNSDDVALRDHFQRNIELRFIESLLRPCKSILEVGSGTGIVTQLLLKFAERLDGFDASEEMLNILRKKITQANCNIRLDSLPTPTNEYKDDYDIVVSCRVLINLESSGAQAAAIEWIASRLKTGGLLILIEGSSEGLDQIDKMRLACGLSILDRAQFNLNMSKKFIEQNCNCFFELQQYQSSGTYDYLTRIYYPLLVGQDKLQYNTQFHNSAYVMHCASPKDELSKYSRLHMLAFRKK